MNFWHPNILNLFVLSGVQNLIGEKWVRAKKAWYDITKKEVFIQLSNGGIISFPSDWVETLREALPSQVSKVRLLDGGLRLVWEDLKEEINLAGMIDSIDKKRAC